jgi:hypothetical protein
VSSPRSRRLLAGLLAIAPLAALLALAPVLPPPGAVPAHWGVGGDVDRVMSGTALLGTTLTLTVISALTAGLVAGLSRLVTPRWSRVVLAGCAAVGAGAAAVYVLTVLGVRAGGSADAVTAWWALAAFPVAAGWSWLTYAVHGEHRPPLAEVLDTVPELDRVVPVTGAAPGVPWRSDTTSPSLRWVGVFVAAVAVAVVVLLVGSGDGWVPALLLGVPGLALALVVHSLAQVRAEVDAEGLRLRPLHLPVTVLRVRAEDVVGVGVADLDPLAWGGWGLRWLPDRSAYIASGGPGLVVHRRSGRRLAVELTEGALAAAAGRQALRAVAGQALAGESTTS